MTLKNHLAANKIHFWPGKCVHLLKKGEMDIIWYIIGEKAEHKTFQYSLMNQEIRGLPKCTLGLNKVGGLRPDKGRFPLWEKKDLKGLTYNDLYNNL